MKSVAELKKALHAAGMSQAGDKGTLEHRLSLFERCRGKQLNVNGVNPCVMKLGDLKKSAAVCGVSPIGSQDEILALLVQHLEKNQIASGPEASSSTTKDGGAISAIAVATRVLELAENEDYEGVLNLGALPGAPITRASSEAVMRKAYLKLSLLIHPDKLGRTFPEATKAFQALVRAFEYLSSAEQLDQQAKPEGKSMDKAMSIARSNEGCFRTKVCCPRCKQPWSEGTLDGNPDYFYNFLMTGLKQFTCSTCLCEFGCVTAIHRCPICKGRFEYSHKDYHRKITCGNAKCNKPFGFHMYHASERVLKALRQEIREELERRRKSRESKLRRANSRRGREEADQEAAYILGLTDNCPRCGVFLEDCGDEEAARRHLMECTDESAHKAFAEKKQAEQRREVKRSERAAQQEDLQSLAAWEFLGSDTSQLYLLSETQLKDLAAEKGVSNRGSKDQVIARILQGGDQASGAPAIEDAKGDSRALVKSRGTKRRRVEPGTVPSNLSSLSLVDLRSICAAHGIPYTASSTEGSLVRLIERDLFDDDHLDGNHEIIVIDD